MAAADQNPKIVVSYRRSDSAMAGRIFDRLAQRFGKTNLFIDIDNIPYGVDFRKHIDEELRASSLVIALVGPNWLGASESGKQRIMHEADPVRVELETALRQEIPILPVLLDDTKMPEPSELPSAVEDFAYRNAVEVESGRDFNVHVERLIAAVDQILASRAPLAEAAATLAASATQKPARTPHRAPHVGALPLYLTGGALLLAVVIALVIWAMGDRPVTAQQDAGSGSAAELPATEKGYWQKGADQLPSRGY